MIAHRQGRFACDGKGFVRVVGNYGEYTWDICDECVARDKAIARRRREWYNGQIRDLVEECQIVKHAMRSVGIRARISPYIKPPRYPIGDITRGGVRVEILEGE